MSDPAARKPYVIDADGHVIEPLGLWREYTERRFHDRLPRPVTDENGLFCYVVDDTLLMRTASRLRAPAKSDASSDPTRSAPEGDPAEELRPGGWDAKARLDDMDLDGMDLAFLYPTTALFLAEVTDAELQAVLCRAYNNWLADYCLAAPDRLVGIALLPLADVNASIVELERCTNDHGFRGAFMRPNPYANRLIQSRSYDPFWECAESLGVPVTVHEGISDHLPTLGRDRSENPVMHHLMSHPFEQMAACAGLVLGGVMERHPTLSFVFLESGCGWLPYWLARMDGHAKSWGHKLDLRMKPSEYFERQCFISMDPDDESAPAVIDQLGVESLVWASDYPHTDHDFPGAVRGTLEILSRGPAGAAEQVLNQNPRRLYGLPTAKV